MQAAMVLIFAPFASVVLNPLNVLATLGTMFITALALSSLGVVIAMWISDFENFGTIQNFITLPLYMFSGAIFPTRSLPEWLSIVLLVNPLSYGAGAIRASLLHYEVARLPLDLAVLCVFTLVMLTIAVLLARREV